MGVWCGGGVAGLERSSLKHQFCICNNVVFSNVYCSSVVFNSHLNINEIKPDRMTCSMD